MVIVLFDSALCYGYCYYMLCVLIVSLLRSGCCAVVFTDIMFVGWLVCLLCGLRVICVRLDYFGYLCLV